MTMEKINPFMEILREAAKHKWCVKPSCTTCGALKFRSALRSIHGVVDNTLVDDLINIDVCELISFPNWDDAIEITIGTLSLNQKIVLLESWLLHIAGSTLFFDTILYKIIRNLPEEYPVRTQWIAKCIDLALETRNFSLVESLILTLRWKAVQYKEFITIANELAAESSQMQRVLKRYGLDYER